MFQEYPRLGLMKDLKENMCSLCVTKPETTYDNTVGEWGDRYVAYPCPLVEGGPTDTVRYVEGYSRKGKLTQDLLETCNLDEIEPK